MKFYCVMLLLFYVNGVMCLSQISFIVLAFASFTVHGEDVEISQTLSQKMRREFISSDDPYQESGRQILYTNDALVKNTQDLFGSECNLAWNLEDKGEVNFTSPNYGSGQNYPANFSCHLSFTGSQKCIPVMFCPGQIDIRSTAGAPCANEYVLVSDGLGGEQKWCGGMVFHPIRASGLGRDLYVKIQTSPKEMKQSKKGFRCTVRCQRDEDKNAKPLEQLEDYNVKHIFQCVCGYQNKEDRIVGGKDANENEFPWLAAFVQKGTRSPVCGGSLINSQWILTASHCFFNTNYTANDLDVVLHADLLDMLVQEGADNEAELGQKGSIRGPGWDKDEKSDKQEHAQRYAIQRIVVHPLYTKKYDFDVALVQIKPSINLAKLNAPTPICLPRVGYYNQTWAGQKVTVAGWGKAHEKAAASTRKLQKLEGMPIIDFQQCVEMMKPKYEITPRMICSGFLEGGRDACTGDSGGPLMFEEGQHRFRQVGVVSFGSGCARRKSPGVYSRLNDLAQWVIYHTNQVRPTWCRDSYNTAD